ncbi:MAG: ABC transporter ATP-binding protein [Agathobacter sp.]|nr:ABC transporter ATP-binding protein [Agathobacter sp.]
MEKYTIDVKHIVKRFKNETILNDVSIHFESGKIYGILGYNGSGKTVLFKCICGFYNVDEGEISVNGRIMGRDVSMLQDAGIIIEEPGYIRTLSGYRNLDLLYRINNRGDKEHVKNVMLKVGLNPKSHKKVGKYSLGMRQRLAIAQATMENQRILILDEPMNGLDKKGVIEMRKFFQEQKKEGKLIIMASHSSTDIDILCDEVYEIDGGILKQLK